MNEIIEVKEESIEIYSEEDCIININDTKENLSVWIYRSYKRGEDSFKRIMLTCSISVQTALNYVKYENAQESLKLPLILKETKTSLMLSQGVYQFLRGNSPMEREHNFQKIYSVLEDMPTSHDIRIYNAISSHAKTGEELGMVNDIFRRVSIGSSSLQKKFWNPSSPYKIRKVWGAIKDNADESVLIGLADTGNLIATKSSKSDREEIGRLNEEIRTLHNRLEFFENSLAKKRIEQLMRVVDYTIKSLKKVGGDKKLIDALKLIGVEVTVSESELKTAYKNKVSIHHPDKDGEVSIFHEIVTANRIIKNHIKRITNG